MEAGKEYEELAAIVIRSLDPGAVVETGEWTERPDGGRELDVAIRGTEDGNDRLVLIACKDSGRPAGVDIVNALKSKRQDLGADGAMIYSNSGFTTPALTKAARVGIDTASAVAAGDDEVRVRLFREFVAKRKAIRRASLVLMPHDDDDETIPIAFSLHAVTHMGDPVANWFAEESLDLLSSTQEDCELLAKYVFKRPVVFVVGGLEVPSKGFGATLECTVRFVSQTVRPDVTLGHFDFQKQRVVVPPKQGYMLGWFDNLAWRETEKQWEGFESLGPGRFALRLTLFDPVPRDEECGTPDLRDLISEREIVRLPPQEPV
jgi:hypothetical protein